MNSFKKQQGGFTLIELVMVIVILGILAASALPRFVDLGDDALAAAKKGMSGAVKSAHSIEVAKRAAAGTSPVNPPLSDLANAITPAGTVAADFSGIEVKINGNTHKVPVYTNDNCTGAPSAATSNIACVGEIS